MEEADLPQAFGATVRELRQRRGISQEGLAAQAGIDRAYMGSIERGRRNPSLTLISRVAAGLGMRMSEVLRAVEKTGGA